CRSGVCSSVLSLFLLTTRSPRLSLLRLFLQLLLPCCKPLRYNFLLHRTARMTRPLSPLLLELHVSNLGRFYCPHTLLPPVQQDRFDIAPVHFPSFQRSFHGSQNQRLAYIVHPSQQTLRNKRTDHAKILLVKNNRVCSSRTYIFILFRYVLFI